MVVILHRILEFCHYGYNILQNYEFHCAYYNIFLLLVKLLDWGEDGFATDAETAALRASFQQEVAVWHKLDHPNVTKVSTLFKLHC